MYLLTAYFTVSSSDDVEFFKPSWHGTMVWNSKNLVTSLYVGNFPVTHVTGSFGEVGVMEFGLNWVQHGAAVLTDTNR